MYNLKLIVVIVMKYCFDAIIYSKTLNSSVTLNAFLLNYVIRNTYGIDTNS